MYNCRGERSKSRVHWPSSSSEGAHVMSIKHLFSVPNAPVHLMRSREMNKKKKKKKIINISRRHIEDRESDFDSQPESGSMSVLSTIVIDESRKLT